MHSMPSNITRDQFENDNDYYWALSDYYDTDEAQDELLAALKRGLKDGTALQGEEAKAAGRAFLLEACGLPQDSDISNEDLIALCLRESKPLH